MLERCEWAGREQIYVDYHDKEWGVPVHDDRLLFEFLILEGMQAGLSWITILKKRENFRRAFDNFDAERIVKYGENKIDEFLNNPGIIRNKIKIAATIDNAKAFIRIKEEFKSFDRYIWQFTDGRIKLNRWKTIKEIPASTFESDRMSKELKSFGFKFVGTTICYAFMQAIGMVNDHILDCFRYEELIERIFPSSNQP